MSQVKMKETNDSIKSLLTQIQNDPITQEDSLADTTNILRNLTAARNSSQIEFEKAKAKAIELQDKLSSTYANLQRCSADDVPTLNKKLTDLQGEYDAISRELNVTNELVVPLQAIVRKGRDDLKKCLEREKQVVASLKQSGISINTVVPPVETQPITQPTLQIPRPSVQEPEWMSKAPSPSPGLALLKNLTGKELLAMDESLLSLYGANEGVDLDQINNITELQDAIWRLRRHQILSEPSLTVEQIALWSREKLESVVADPEGYYNGIAVKDLTTNALVDNLVLRKTRFDWKAKLAKSNPELLQKLFTASVKQLFKWVRRTDKNYMMVGHDAAEQADNVYWRAIEIATTIPAV